MSPSDNNADLELLRLIREGDVNAYGMLYDRYGQLLYHYIDKRIQNKEESREIVQDIFEWLWRDRSNLGRINTSVRNFFYVTAKNRILNFVRDRNIHVRYMGYLQSASDTFSNETENAINLRELEGRIDKSIKELPDRCQTIFRMSRVNNESIQNIAKELNLSTNTVENNITRALKHLRQSLGLLSVFLLMFF